jgi:uncharacterized membrane protein
MWLLIRMFCRSLLQNKSLGGTDMVVTLALLRVGVNPFDLKTIFLARHAQHVVLIHFPIALFISTVVFDIVADCTGRRTFADACYYNLSLAAISLPLVIATGVLAWQLQLEGQKIRGVLLLHLVLACAATGLIWLAWWLHFRSRRRTEALPQYRLVIEVLAVAAVTLTGYLGGFLSGVNQPG